MPNCPYCSASLEWESSCEVSPDVDESYYRCPDPACDVVTVRLTGGVV